MILPDILAPGLRVVFCGSAVGNESFRRKAYYAHPQNRFWCTLRELGLTPIRLQPTEYERVKEWGIGLTDLAKHVHGGDAKLKRSNYEPEQLHEKIERDQPLALAFTGKKPASVYLAKMHGLREVRYGKHAVRIGRTAIFVLPSPSPAARRYWDIRPWRALARFVRDTPPVTGDRLT